MNAVLRNIRSFGTPHFEVPEHLVRWNTLLRMSEMHFAEDSDKLTLRDAEPSLGSLHRPADRVGARSHKFVEVQLALPVDGDGDGDEYAPVPLSQEPLPTPAASQQ